MGFLLDMFEAEVARRRRRAAERREPASLLGGDDGGNRGAGGRAAVSDAPTTERIRAPSWLPSQCAPMRRPAKEAPGGIDRSLPAGDRDDDEDGWL